MCRSRRREPSWRRLAVALCATVALGVAAGARGQDSADTPSSRGEDLASAGRCDEAIPLLEEARAERPEDGRLAGLLGQCQARLQRWDAAAASFAAAKRLDPTLRDVDLHLAIARYHAGDIDGAATALDEARLRSPGDAELALYEGLVGLERDEDPRAAAEALELARARDPARVEPVASYYAGVAWLRANERERAREALERVRSEAPGTSWAQAAERALAARDGRGTRGLLARRDLVGLHQAERPLGSYADIHRAGPWVSVSGGLEYDSNVVLRGDGVSLPREISDESDFRGVWTAQVGSELWRNRDWVIGAFGAYYGSAHFDLTDFNTQYPSATFWVDRRLGDTTTGRLQYDFSHAWVGGDPYLREHSLTPALFHGWGERWGTSRLFADLSWENYRFDSNDVPDGTRGGGCTSFVSPCGPPGLDEESARDRDGFWGVVGLDHVIPIARLRTDFSFGYRFHVYDAEGREYRFRGHEGQVGARTYLPWRVVLDVQGRFTWRGYADPSTYPDPDDLVIGRQYQLSNRDKRERVWEADAIVERPITDWLLASVRYEYHRNDANVKVFDYDRHVVGGYLTFTHSP